MIVVLGSAVAREGHMAEALALSKELSSARGQNLLHLPRRTPRRRESIAARIVEQWSDQAALWAHFKVPAVPKLRQGARCTCH